MIDLTSCPTVLSAAYNGANGKKICVLFNNNRYMIKFPPTPKRAESELSYTNSCISEHIGSTIFNLIGIDTQQTFLAKYNVGNKEKIVCACKDFVKKGFKFFDFCSIKNTVLESSSNGTGTELADIYDTINNQGYIDHAILVSHFWDMFIVDAFLGNFDRHNGNWGFLVNEETQECHLAPIYDCGSCLLPHTDEKMMRFLLENEEEMNSRVYVFPTSAIKCNGLKINYFDFISSNVNKDCTNALLRVFPRIDLSKIESFINSIEGLTAIQCAFYKKYLRERYERILLFSYKKIMQETDN